MTCAGAPWPSAFVKNPIELLHPFGSCLLQPGLNLPPTMPPCGLYWSSPVGGPLAGVTGAGVKLSSGKIFSIRVPAQSLASLGSILWNCSAGRNGLISAILHWPILHVDKNSKAFDHIGESC